MAHSRQQQHPLAITTVAVLVKLLVLLIPSAQVVRLFPGAVVALLARIHHECAAQLFPQCVQPVPPTPIQKRSTAMLPALIVPYASLVP
jgi:hypothetical protein